MRFDGAAVLVTGGTSGIGAATALAFAREGARVVITGRDAARGAEVGAQVKGPGRISFIEADFSDPHRAGPVIEQTVALLGGLDVLVNNAGVYHRTGTLESSDHEWLDTITVNVNAVFLLSQAAAKVMKARGKGAIVNLSSQVGIYAVPNAVSYCTSKAAILQMTKAMALDLAPHKIRVNAVAPGLILTPMLEQSFAKRGENVAQGLKRTTPLIPMGREAWPEEVASVILWLASDDASFVTGARIPIDGGNAATGPMVPADA